MKSAFITHIHKKIEKGSGENNISVNVFIMISNVFEGIYIGILGKPVDLALACQKGYNGH